MNRYVHFVVDFPRPTIVVHRPHRQVLAVEQVYLGMKHSLRRLINRYVVADESLKKHVVEDAFEDWLITLSRGQYGRRDTSFDGVNHFPVKLKHGVVVWLDDFYFLFCLSHVADHIVFDFPPVCCQVVVQ